MPYSTTSCRAAEMAAWAASSRLPRAWLARKRAWQNRLCQALGRLRRAASTRVAFHAILVVAAAAQGAEAVADARTARDATPASCLAGSATKRDLSRRQLFAESNGNRC